MGYWPEKFRHFLLYLYVGKLVGKHLLLLIRNLFLNKIDKIPQAFKQTFPLLPPPPINIACGGLPFGDQHCLGERGEGEEGGMRKE